MAAARRYERFRRWLIPSYYRPTKFALCGYIYAYSAQGILSLLTNNACPNERPNELAVPADVSWFSFLLGSNPKWDEARRKMIGFYLIVA